MEHEHKHEHHHDHEHEHEHEHTSGTPQEQTVALLSYMVEHNEHHAQELADLSRVLEGEAGHILSHAVETFRQANRQMEEALALLKK